MIPIEIVDLAAVRQFEEPTDPAMKAINGEYTPDSLQSHAWNVPRSSTSLRRKGVPRQTVLVHTSRPTLGVLGLMLGRIPVERRRIPTVRTRSEPFRNQANSSPGHLTVEARTVTITIAVMYSSSTCLPRRAQAT